MKSIVGTAGILVAVSALTALPPSPAGEKQVKSLPADPRRSVGRHAVAAPPHYPLPTRTSRPCALTPVVRALAEFSSGFPVDSEPSTTLRSEV